MPATLRVAKVAFAAVLLLAMSGCTAVPSSMLSFWNPQDEDPRVVPPAKKIAQLQQLAKECPKLPQAEHDRLALELARELRIEEDPLVRAQLLRTLAVVRSDTATAMLRAGIQDADADVRAACCQAWGRRGGAEAVRVLEQVLRDDEEIDVRLAAVRALGQIGGPESVAALALALEDNDPAMRYRAMRSLAAVTGQDYGTDVGKWREYIAGRPPAPESWVSRLTRWF